MSAKAQALSALRQKQSNNKSKFQLSGSNQNRSKAKSQLPDQENHDVIQESQRHIKTDEDQPNNDNSHGNNSPQNSNQEDFQQYKINIEDHSSSNNQNSQQVHEKHSTNSIMVKQERKSMLNSQRNSKAQFKLDIDQANQAQIGQASPTQQSQYNQDTYENYLSSQRNMNKTPGKQQHKTPDHTFFQLKPPKSNHKKFYVEIQDLQNINVTDNIICILELVDRDDNVIVGEKGECYTQTLLKPIQENQKLSKFEHQQIFYINENTINENVIEKPQLKITLKLEKNNTIIGIVQFGIVNKKKRKFRKGIFTKQLYSFCPIRNIKVKTPFLVNFIMYKDVPQKWISMVNRRFNPNQDKGFVVVLQNITDYLDMYNLSAEFVLVNAGTILKDHNLDQILYGTSGFNKFDQQKKTVRFHYQQRLFINKDFLYDQNRNNLNKLFLIFTIYKQQQNMGNEREEWGWYAHPLFRLREYNTGEFSVNLFKAPCKSKIVYNFDDIPKLKSKLNFRFLGFDEVNAKDLEVYSVRSEDFQEKPNKKMVNSYNQDTDMSSSADRNEHQEFTGRGQVPDEIQQSNKDMVKKKMRKKVESRNHAQAEGQVSQLLEEHSQASKNHFQSQQQE